MDERGSTTAQGSVEVLIIDREAEVLEGFSSQLADAAFQITATEDAERALDLAAQKHFAVAVIDADTPEEGAGLQVLARLRDTSPATAVILLVTRTTLEQVLRGFRGGAADVVVKGPEGIVELPERVTRLCQEARRVDERDRLLREVLEVHEGFFKRLMDASRRALQAEEMGRGEQGRWDLKECHILVVDENPRTGPGLQEALGQESGYHVVPAISGGEALDYGSQHEFHIAMVNERISDLPWRMVVQALRRHSGSGLVLLLTEPDQGPGRLVIVEESQEIEVIAQLSRGNQLVEAIHKLREAYLAKSRERHYLQHFRKEHYDFLKRYVELRQKLSVLKPGIKP